MNNTESLNNALNLLPWLVPAAFLLIVVGVKVFLDIVLGE